MASTALYSSPDFVVLATAADYDIRVNDPKGQNRLCREITVGTGGTLVVTRDDASVVTLPTMPDGHVFSIQAASIIAAGSTAKKIIVSW